MPIRYRPMRCEDVAACVGIVASVPTARQRYGDALGDLCAAWRRLLECEAKVAVVFEEVTESRTTICGIGVSVFVRDEFAEELKARPFWFAPELARRLTRGDSPLLSDRELREANSRGGLTVLVWEGRIAPEFEGNAEVYRKIASGFIETHRGYLCKEAICHQIETVERLNWTVQTGGLFWDPSKGSYTDLPANGPEEFLNRPHILGLTREIEMKRPAGSWVGCLFEYQPPRLCFSLSEQRLLKSALDGATDQELSDELGISLFTAKKTWRSIYDRVTLCSPELVPANSKAEERISERGREKKQRLIAYLREHPEELRPIARKLLQKPSHGCAHGPFDRDSLEPNVVGRR